MPNEPAEPVPTASTIIQIALRKAGVVGIDESIETTMLNDAVADANDLLAQWARSRYLIYRLVNYAKLSTGALTYSVGKGGDFNINPRPDRVESAFVRLNPTTPNFVDLPVDIIPARENYDEIVMKNLGVTNAGVGSALPWRVFYDPGSGSGDNSTWAVGTVYPWPVPQAGLYELHLTFKETLNRFADLNETINLPPEYVPALKFGLARVLRASYQMPRDPEINFLARRAMNSIRKANVAVPVARMPRAVSGRRRAYDWHSDT